MVYAQVAQLVEQRTENPRVGSSILSLGTISSNEIKTQRLETLYVENSPIRVAGPVPRRAAFRAALDILSGGMALIVFPSAMLW
jgi:hypothetical protein